MPTAAEVPLRDRPSKQSKASGRRRSRLPREVEESLRKLAVQTLFGDVVMNASSPGSVLYRDGYGLVAQICVVGPSQRKAADVQTRFWAGVKTKHLSAITHPGLSFFVLVGYRGDRPPIIVGVPLTDDGVPVLAGRKLTSKSTDDPHFNIELLEINGQWRLNTFDGEDYLKIGEFTTPLQLRPGYHWVHSHVRSGHWRRDAVDLEAYCDPTERANLMAQRASNAAFRIAALPDLEGFDVVPRWRTRRTASG